MLKTRKLKNGSPTTISLVRGDQTMTGRLCPYVDSFDIFFPDPDDSYFDENGKLIAVPKSILVDKSGQGENGWAVDF